MKIVVSADLAGLGDTEGAPVIYAWTPPNPLPQLLPWLAVLALLGLKSNRTAKAWWIWLPLVGIAGMEAIARQFVASIPAEQLDFFCRGFASLAFGMAGVWLLGVFLRDRLRFLVFLKMLVTVAVVSAVVFLARVDWQGDWITSVGFLLFIGLCLLVLVGALSLAGWVSRGKYQPVRFTLWLALFIMAVWTAIATPFFVFAAAMSQGPVPWMEFAQALLAFTGLTFAVVLPFLILAFTNVLFRERLQGLLHLETACPTAAPVSPPPTVSPPTEP